MPIAEAYLQVDYGVKRVIMRYQCSAPSANSADMNVNQWCRAQFAQYSWHQNGDFYFKREKDAAWFNLRWS